MRGRSRVGKSARYCRRLLLLERGLIARSSGTGSGILIETATMMEMLARVPLNTRYPNSMELGDCYLDGV